MTSCIRTAFPDGNDLSYLFYLFFYSFHPTIHPFIYLPPSIIHLSTHPHTQPPAPPATSQPSSHPAFHESTNPPPPTSIHPPILPSIQGTFMESLCQILGMQKPNKLSQSPKALRHDKQLSCLIEHERKCRV